LRSQFNHDHLSCHPAYGFALLIALTILALSAGCGGKAAGNHPQRIPHIDVGWEVYSVPYLPSSKIYIRRSYDHKKRVYIYDAAKEHTRLVRDTGIAAPLKPLVLIVSDVDQSVPKTHGEGGFAITGETISIVPGSHLHLPRLTEAIVHAQWEMGTYQHNYGADLDHKSLLWLGLDFNIRRLNERLVSSRPDLDP